MVVSYVFASVVCSVFVCPESRMTDAGRCKLIPEPTAERCVLAPPLNFKSVGDCRKFQDELADRIAENIILRAAPDGTVHPRFCRPQNGQVFRERT